ncbi:hypothetical protein HG531_010011 [Fusarium graminearum]|nr:hypothetical protein HG531_010011 [Fusarium graminearum]
MAPLDSLLQLCVCKDDRGALTTTLKCDVLQVVRSVLHNGSAGVGTTGKGNLVNIHMSSNSFSSRRAKTSLDGFAADLVGGTGVVAEDVVRLVEITSETGAEGLQGSINSGNELTVAINQIGNLVKKSAAVNSSKLRPLALKGFTSSLDGFVDIFF